MPREETAREIRRRPFLGNCAAGLGALFLAAMPGQSLAQKTAEAPAPISPARSSGALKAGAARRVVTAPLSVPYLTSSGNGTNAAFAGVHDDLHARALVLEEGAEAAAVLAVDSIGYDNGILGLGRNFTAEVRRRIAAATGLRPEAVMLAATHAHSTPETIGLSPLREAPGAAEWLEQHVEALAATVIEAWQRRAPARARFGTGSVSGIARNRRILLKDGTLSRRGPVPALADAAGPWALDEDLAVLFIETEQEQPVAALLNYAAHPVVTMLLPSVSADFPGAASTMVERVLPGAVCLFTTGAAANLNSMQVSTSYDDAEALGRTLASAALAEIARLQSAPPLAGPSIRTASRTLRLEGRACPSLEEAQRIAADKPTAANLKQLRLARKLAEGPIEAEVQLIQLGAVQWVSLPGEPFVETGLALKRAGAAFVVGYANGYVGYLPIRAAFGEGGYEVDAGPWSRVAAGGAEQLESAARLLLRP